MITYVLVGGMKGTTWVQIIKAVLLVLGAGIMTLWVLAKYAFNLSSLLGAAVDNSPAAGEKLLNPGLQYGATGISKLDFISLALALVLGTAGLPHVLMRFYTVPNSKEARRSVSWAIWIIGIFYLFTLVLGYGAAALVGPDAIRAAPGKANSAAPLLAFELGGELLLGVISAVAFATILAVVAGLTITASTSFAHDIYGQVIKKGQVSARRRGPGRPDHRAGDRCWSRSSAASSPTARTSRSWWRWRSRSRPARTCRPSCTRCSGGGSTPAARCGASTAVWARRSS